MFDLGVPELLVLVVLVVLGAVFTVNLTNRDPRRERVRPTRESRLVQLTRGLGGVIGLVAAVLVASWSSLGRGAMLAPAVFGLCLVAGTALGETVVRPPRPDGPRTASVLPRRWRDYTPLVTSALVGLMTVLTAALLVFTTVTASTDPGSGEARALSCRSGSTSQLLTPYAGSYYSVPLAGVLLGVLVVGGLAARQVVRRPRGIVPDDLGDDALRRRSLDVLVATVGIAVCATYVGIADVSGAALSDLADGPGACGPAWMGSLSSVVLGTNLLAMGVGLACLVRLIAGSTWQFVRLPVGARH